MSEKYDLKRVLAEIREDEGLSGGPKGLVTQAEIGKLVSRRRKARAKGDGKRR